jgi:hypothetical protein
MFDCDRKLIILKYNTPTDSEERLLGISTVHLQNLAETFVKYNVHDRLGAHLIDSHAEVAASYLMVGHKLTDPSGCWTKPTPMEEANLA